jgi:HlyD family secretion protein
MDRTIEKKKWPPKRIVLFSVSGIFITLVLYQIFFADFSSKYNVDLQKITISAVTKGPFQEYIPVTGTVVPIKTVYLDAIEGGRVEQVFLEAGTMVEAGDKILELSNTNLMMDIMFREAEFYEQSNNLRNTRLDMEKNQLHLKAELIDFDYEIKKLKRSYQRNKELLKSNLISVQEYEEIEDLYEYNLKRRNLAIESYMQDSLFRKIQIGQLENSLNRMQDNLGLVRSKLDNLIIKAPVSGLLSSRFAEIGESKNSGQRLGQIDVLDGFKVLAAIDEHYLSRISAGLPGLFLFGDKEYSIVSSKIYPEIIDGRFDVDMEFVSDEPEGIRRGQTVHIRLSLGDSAEALLLERGGFYQTTGGQWVYVIDESGDFAVKRNIRLGRQNPQTFEVLEGLQPGERVITSSYDNFGDNDKLILK